MRNIFFKKKRKTCINVECLCIYNNFCWLTWSPICRNSVMPSLTPSPNSPLSLGISRHSLFLREVLPPHPRVWAMHQRGAMLLLWPDSSSKAGMSLRSCLSLAVVGKARYCTGIQHSRKPCNRICRSCFYQPWLTDHPFLSQHRTLRGCPSPTALSEAIQKDWAMAGKFSFSLPIRPLKVSHLME